MTYVNKRKGMQYTDMISQMYPELTQRAFDSGYEKPLTQTFTFQVTDDCNLACFAAGTKILMSDFTYKNIENIQIGDEVLAFDEKTPKGKQLKLKPTVVTHTFVRHDYVRKIRTADGEEIICTDEHPFLDGRKQWVRAEDINTQKKLTKFLGLSHYKQADITDINYMTGYVISAFLGDGHMFFYKHCNLVNKPGSQSRLAVKDIEILERVKSYLPYLGISYTTHPFKISTKENIFVDAIYLNKENSLKLKDIIESNWNINDDYNYYCGFLAGIIDTEGNVEKKSGYVRIFNSHLDIMKQCETALTTIGFNYTYDTDKKTVNTMVKVLRILNPRNTTEVLRLQLIIRNAVPRKGYKSYYGSSSFERVDVQSVENLSSYIPVYNFETTTHTYIANNFAVHNCTYCYQLHKGKRSMSLETAKKCVDMLLTGEKGMSEYVNPISSPAIILEFIGGEPFMEVELIQQVYEYFLDKAMELNHPWATLHRISICSNGVLYFDPKVQEFLNKYGHNLSFSVTVDGNKELHDACRVFPDGKPSYDLAVAAAKDWMSRGGSMGSKITIAPENVMHLYDALTHMVELGYDDINANCVYEKGWTPVHATVLYDQMKKVADYFLEKDFDFVNGEFKCSLYEDHFFHPKEPDDLQNWCFRAGTKILTPDGNKNIEELNIGDEVISGSGSVQKVTDIKRRFTRDTCVIKAECMDDTYTTIDHPYLVVKHPTSVNKESPSLPMWVEVGDIEPDDKLILIDDGKYIFGNVVSVEGCDGYEVYNLTISNEHTFVANNAIVHNCGGNGVMLSCDPDGVFFPCIRYMESSLAGDQEPYSIGNVDVGICQTHCDKCRVECLKKIDRRTQSTDECFNCPIAEGCSWCTAYNYQVFGTPDARATFICIMHKARALGNLYFWNKYYRKYDIAKRMKNYVPDEWALEIINQSELDMLKELAKEDF